MRGRGRLLGALLGALLFGCTPTGSGSSAALDGSVEVPDDGAPAADQGARLDAGAPHDARLPEPDAMASEPDAMAPEPDAMAPEPDAMAPEPDRTPRCPEVEIGPPPAALQLDAFYTRYTDAGGIPIISGPDVPDEAFRVAVYLTSNMLRGLPCARAAIIEAELRIGIFGPDDVTTDLPEYSDFYEAFPGTDWDNRGRGYGATIVRPLTSVGFENLMRLPEDLWLGEMILIHELAHTIFEFGVEERPGGAEMRARLEALYAEAMAAGRWANTYAATNANEYWAEGVQSWFDDNLSSEVPNGVHGPIDTRVELEEYDPGLAGLIAEVFDPSDWPRWCDPDGAGPAWAPPPVEDVACDLTWASAEDLGCEAAPISLRSDQPVAGQIVNRAVDRVLRVDWIDFEGNLRDSGPVLPRTTWNVNTFETHAWRITEDGRCVAQFVAGDQSTRFIVER